MWIELDDICKHLYCLKYKSGCVAGAGPSVNGGGAGEGAGLLLWKTQGYRGRVLTSLEFDNSWL